MLRIYIVPALCVVVVCLKLPPKCNALPVEDVVRPLTEKLVQVVVLKPVQLRIDAPPFKSQATWKLVAEPLVGAYNSNDKVQVTFAGKVSVV